MAEAEGPEMTEKKEVENVPAQQFPGPSLKRSVQEPNEKVTKKRKEYQKEVKISKTSKTAPATAK